MGPEFEPWRRPRTSGSRRSRPKPPPVGYAARGGLAPKLPLAWERSSRAARTPARAKRRPRQNDVLENRLFRAPLQLLRATAKRTAAAREAAATRGDNRQPCSSGTLQPRVKRGGAHGRGRQCREALRLLMPRCFGRGGCAAAIAAIAPPLWLSIVAPRHGRSSQIQPISSAKKSGTSNRDCRIKRLIQS